MTLPDTRPRKASSVSTSSRLISGADIQSAALAVPVLPAIGRPATISPRAAIQDFFIFQGSQPFGRLVRHKRRYRSVIFLSSCRVRCQAQFRFLLDPDRTAAAASVRTVTCPVISNRRSQRCTGTWVSRSAKRGFRKARVVRSCSLTLVGAMPPTLPARIRSAGQGINSRRQCAQHLPSQGEMILLKC
jgi:hypothetical protein